MSKITSKIKKVKQRLTKHNPSKKEELYGCASSASSVSCHDQESREQRIRTKAYELYEKKGYRQGEDKEDWNNAECLIGSD